MSNPPLLFARLSGRRVAEGPLTERQLRARLRESVSLPMDLTGVDLSDVGYAAIQMPEAPSEAPKPLHRWIPAKPRWKGDVLVGSWTQHRAPADKVERRWRDVRADRNARLARSDWTQLPDAAAAMGEAKAKAWREYRQALRDVTAQVDPFQIEWPAPPDVEPPAS